MKTIPTPAASIPSSTIQWAIVAPGKIAHKFARDLRVAEGAQLRAVAGRDLSRTRSFAAEFGAPLCFDDVSALAADPSVDIVYIASPHNAHFATAKIMLEAGKPVLCEKPMTINARQARELIDLSRSNGVFLMEALWTRFLPVYSQVREWLDGGLIGRPQVVTSTFCFQAPRDFSSRMFNPALAGGGLLDLGVYPLAISQMVLGRKPDHVTATAQMSETGVDEMLAVSLRYANGSVAQFICGLNAHLENSLMIGGDKGFIRLPEYFISGKQAVLNIGGSLTTIHQPTRGEGFEYQIEEAMRCLRAGEIESPIMPHDDTLATLETMDEIRRQIGLRYPEEIDEV
jgi:predicted dehydrogenase